MIEPKQQLHPRRYLKEVGLDFSAKPTHLDRRFIKTLPDEDKAKAEEVYAAARVGRDLGTHLYTIPKSLRQACALFSHDAERYLVSMAWIAELIARTQPSSLVDMGCGAGLLLNYLQRCFPSIEVNGVDAARNLVSIGSDLCGQSLLHGDYLSIEPDQTYEMIVCEFGYDNSKIPPSTRPHSAGRCGQAEYCPGCAEDAQIHFVQYMRAWRRWAAPRASLALTGRMTDYTDVRAVTLAAKEVGWFVCLDKSRILTTRDRLNQLQRFPAWYFTSDESIGASNEDVANFYVTGRTA